MRLVLLLGLAIAVAWPGRCLAQEDQRTPPRRFDAEAAYLTFSWVARPSRSFAIGPELGAGFLEQKVFAPSGDDLTGVVHVGVVSALRVTGGIDAEVGVRAGLGELRSIACAGCGFSGYRGLSFAVFTGYRKLRAGTRVLLGRVEGDALHTWSPLVLRFQF